MIGPWLLLAGYVVVRDVGGDGPIRWPNPDVTVEIQRDGSDDLDDGRDVAAIQSALGAWNAVPCSRFRFREGPPGTSRAIGRDGVNRITFVEQDWPGYAAGAGAFTVRERDEGDPDVWVEFDIQVNGQDARWAVDGTVSRGDIQSAMVHELGHGLGLQHASDPRATMYFSVRLGTTFARSLHADDVAGACFLYPAAAFRCARDADCPLVYGQYGGGNYRAACSGGACAAGPASDYGAGCFASGDCAGGECLVDPLGPPSSEPGYCSRDCGGAACPDGDYCATTPSGPRCVIGRVDCAVDADCGGMPRVCARQLDGRFQCQRLCLRDAQCATIPGAVCHGGTGANPAGFCRVPGPGVAGTPCASGLECQSLACTGGTVETTCAPLPGQDAGVATDAAPARPDAAVGVGADAAAPAAMDGGPIGGDGAVEGSDGGAADARGSAADARGSAADDQGRIRGGCSCATPRRGPGVPQLILIAGLVLILIRRPRGRRAIRSAASSHPPAEANTNG